jgi:hypothetical protein
MTSNQLTLGRLQEDSRHNKETEKLGYQTLGETSRHNVATEDIGRQNVSLGYATLGETTRHNISTENTQNRLVDSQILSNVANANYTNTKAEYYIDELEIKKQDAETNLLNARTKQEELALRKEIAEYDKLLKFMQSVKAGTESIDNLSGVVAKMSASTVLSLANWL